jgi:DNA invertase Pin-like site-specific DNA recombinase
MVSTTPKTPLAYSYARMSSDVQLKGDSLRRQLEASRDYAAKNGLQLVEENELRDIGLSAFDGSHLSDGALGGFLAKVRNKQIAKGSTLIVESLDRLNRQNPIKAVGLFSGILNSGINIVTLADKKTYTEKADVGDLMLSIVIMARANEESQTKSHRLSAAWENKRKNAHVKKMTALCPAWLSLSKDKNIFTVDKAKETIVRSIFQDSANRRLNRKGIPAIGRSRAWNKVYVARILRNPAVIGKFQPLKKGEPDGEPIDNYFPPIIPEALFYQVNKARAQRRFSGKGRKGAIFSNLFSGLAKCAYCHHSPMRFENKGSGWTYLVCDRARNGFHCEGGKSWRYDDFEKSFLMFVKELDLESLTIDQQAATKRNTLDNKIIILEGRLAVAESAQSNLIDLFAATGKGKDAVAKKLAEMEQNIGTLKTSFEQKQKEREGLASNATSLYESHEQIKELIARLQSKNGNAEELYKLRATIAARLKSLISTLDVAPIGSAPLTKRMTDYLEKKARKESAEIREARKQWLQANDEWQHQRFFEIYFREGNGRIVYPADDNPLQPRQQIVSEPFRDLEVFGFPMAKLQERQRAILGTDRPFGTRGLSPDKVDAMQKRMKTKPSQ